MGRQLARRAAAIGLALAVVEIFLRGVFAYPPVAGRLATNDDLSYRRAWVERQRGATGSINELDVFDPRLGWRPRPNLRIPAIWGGKSLTTNAQGFRSARDFSKSKRPATTRIVALGDSFTFGEEVGDGEPWTDRLEALCPSLEVLNFGVHGYGHDQMLLMLREVAGDYRPDVVLVGYLKTDAYRNLLSFRDYAKPRFRLTGDGLVLTGVPVPAPEAVLRGDRWRPRLLDFALIVSTRFQNLSGIRSLRKERLTAALIREIARTAGRIGARPAIAYLPDATDFESDAENREREEFFRRICRQAEGAACMSVSEPLLAASAGPACCQVPGGYHWNARAHLLAAQSMLASLRRAGLAPGC